MSDELCAREGCGAPKAWHDRNSTIAELYKWDNGGRLPDINPYAQGLACVAADCACRAYLPPEPPKPEGKAYVVEINYDPARRANILVPSADAVPLADYLAAHPQPIPDPQPTHTLCICGGEMDDHDPVTGRCSHVAKRARIAHIGSAVGEDLATWIETLACQCRKFEAQP